jgi:hypothetical protein
MSQVHKTLRQIELLALTLEGPEAEHWRIAFVQDLLAQYRSSGDITFESVQRLLKQHEQAFLADLETARRMYRNYPHLLHEGPGQLEAARAKVTQA